MKSHWKHRLTAELLAACLVLGQSFTPLPAYGGPDGADVSCPHHTHDTACGYREGTPCSHVHGEDCYPPAEVCIHEHGPECYPEDKENGDGSLWDATASDAAKGEATECSHMCSEESGCITKELDCPHSHDSQCGYTAGTPCTFDPADCPVCAGAASDSGLPEGTPGASDTELPEDTPGASGLPGAASNALLQVQTERSSLETIDGVDYTDMGDFTTTSLDLSSSPAGNNIYYAGNGYVLWNGTTKTVTLHDASITALYALEVPAGARIVAEGSSILTGTGSFALVCYSGGIQVTGPGSLMVISQAENRFGWTYAVNAGSGSIDVDIEGNFVTGDDSSGGLQAQSGSITILSGKTVSVNGLIRAGNAVRVEAETGITITNEKNMAIQSTGSGAISLTAGNGSIAVSGGSSMNPYSIQGNSGAVTLDASGEVQVADYNGYPGVSGGSLNLSGTIPAGTTLHSSCSVTVPAGRTLTNHGTLFPNSGAVTVAGTLVNGPTASIENGNGEITPTVTGGGTIEDAADLPDPGPKEVSSLDLRTNAPAARTEYRVAGGGTATWEPGSGGAANRLTLNSVNMTGNTRLVAVPADTEIILTGTNSILATNGDGIYAPDGVLNISGDGSLTVNASGYALYGENGVEVDISGPISIAGEIRGAGGAVAVNSGGAVMVNGSVFGMDSISMEAGKSLSIVNSGGAGLYATGCTSVSLTAGEGDLTVTGTGHSAVYGNATDIDLSASENLDISGHGTSPCSVEGRQLRLSGTIPETATLYASCDVVVPAGRTLTNDGILRMYHTNGTVTVEGTLNNNGAILNGTGIVIPEGNGTINERKNLDFTRDTAAASGPSYSWDSQTKTLTLDGFDNTQSAVSGAAIILPEAAKLVLTGDNKVSSRDNVVIRAMGALEIGGTGSLAGVTGANVALDAQGAVTIQDCTVSLTTTTPDPVRIDVIETNGNALTIDGTAKVTCSVENQDGRGWGIHTGTGALTIGKDAEVTITGAGVGILTGSTPSPEQVTDVKIHGTLDTTGCSLLCANLLGVRLDMEGSSISMKEGTHIWLYQPDKALTGETHVTAFSGLLQAASAKDPTVDYYKVSCDGRTGLHAVGSTLSFTAAPVDGKVFGGWTATGVTLSDPSAGTISFTMPGNEVILETNYATPVSSVSLDVSELSMKAGETRTLAATVWPEDAGNRSVIWSIDREEIATVDNNGVVTARKAGTATITVTTVDGGKTAICVVTVLETSTSDPPVTPDDSSSNSSSDKNSSSSDSSSDKGSSGSQNPGTPGTGLPFTDVKETDWFCQDVKFVYDAGLMPGTGTASFSPYQNAARSQLAVFLYRMEGSPKVEGRNSFPDVKYEPGTRWYYDAVTWVWQNRLMTGCSDGTFQPDHAVIRETLAESLYDYARYRGWDLTAVCSLDGFPDRDSVSPWAQKAMRWAVGKGILTGRDSRLLDPQGTVTRGELAAIFRRFIEKNDLVPAAAGAGGRDGASGWTKRTETPSLPGKRG